MTPYQMVKSISMERKGWAELFHAVLKVRACIAKRLINELEIALSLCLPRVNLTIPDFSG